MVKTLLDEYEAKYNTPAFIKDDPISLPHRFTKLQDREIVGFWVAMLAWGRRSAIIKAGEQLINLLEGEPYNFIKNHSEEERKAWEKFYYRTFQATDALYFLEFLQQHYSKENSLESAFSKYLPADALHIEKALRGFHDYFFSLPYSPDRTRKHVATPARQSTCKRLCLFLRWMVRRDNKGVDFGIWQGISPAQLVIPIDVHVERIARRLGLLNDNEKLCWNTALLLTERLRAFCPQDPVKYDFALFGMGVG